MTLEQKFEAVEPYHTNYLEGLVEVADEFAIDFAEWLRVNYYDNGDFWIAWDYDKDAKTSKELLKVYKKEKGL
jgi:hypothetical protein